MLSNPGYSTKKKKTEPSHSQSIASSSIEMETPAPFSISAQPVSENANLNKAEYQDFNNNGQNAGTSSFSTDDRGRIPVNLDPILRKATIKCVKCTNESRLRKNVQRRYNRLKKKCALLKGKVKELQTVSVRFHKYTSLHALIY